jgi:hypothetical protein
MSQRVAKAQEFLNDVRHVNGYFIPRLSNRVLQKSFCVNYSCYKSLIIKGRFSAFFGKHTYFSALLGFDN